ncbi:MAG TPA: helix-turn-helix domain-containing protein [Candidatus Nanopelagicales bacterium]|nr:helix-turn-helix domain-containing protein [Candidatus Nanopelagicales bacterium]
MEPDQISGVAALAEPVRRDLYAFVAAAPEPVTRDQAADGVAVPRHTAKFHLDKLVEEGLLDVDYKRLSGREGPGAGRPTKRYFRSAREVSVSLPPRRYDLAGELMASAIERSAAQGTDVATELAGVAHEHGAAIGRAATEGLPARPTRAVRVETASAALAAYGYEPRLVDGALTLVNCPFHALAQEHTDLVCGMNLAMLEALVDEVGGLAARLDPAPGRCCVTVG